MISIVAFTACQKYFEKKKALALGLASTGAGLGSLILPAVLRLLFDNLPFSSAMLFYGG